MEVKPDQQAILLIARDIATRAHAGQFRKGNNVPYIKHPEEVAYRVSENWEQEVVAWLHDVLEESGENRESLISQGIPEYLVTEVELLTHGKDISYPAYIDTIATSKIATQVKIADILSNLGDLPSIAQIRRYSEALLKLSKPFVENTDHAPGRNTIDELVEDIRDGLLSHSKNPIGWLTTFIDDLEVEGSAGIIAEKKQIPEHLTKLNKPPNAIIVDCGTGETKLLLYSVEDDKIKFKELLKLNAVSLYIDKSDDFINTVRFYLTKHKADIVLVAASAWLREASHEILYKGNSLLNQLIDSGMMCKILEPREEAWMELAAAEYVSGLLGLNITATYSSGAGSTQFTKNFTEVFPFRLGNEAGRKMISENGTAGIEQWENMVKNVYSESQLQLDGMILCISAVCHAASVCGLQENAATDYTEVILKFESYIQKQTNKEDRSPLENRNLANVIQHLYTLKATIAETATLVFMRDIEFFDNKLRITWSLGWYLDLLSQLDFLNLKVRTLKRFQKEQAKTEKIGQDFEKEIKGKKIANTAAGHVLLDIRETADVILNKANTIEKLVTPQLQFNASQTGARLEGLEFRMKTRDSLIRKLTSRLKRLIANNTSLQLYIPRLADIFNEVDDVLRYTIITEADHYSETVLSFLENLKKEFDCAIKSYSYWKRNSTYLGINSFIKIADFTFEIQFHTNESWNLKQSESHDLYENFRILPNSYAKYLLYVNMKKIWNIVPIPPNVHTIGNTISSTDALMEQYGLIRKLIDIKKGIVACETITPAELKDNICIRLIRGQTPEEFKYISFPPAAKQFSWVASGENLMELLNSDTSKLLQNISDFTGKPLSWVNEKVKDGYSWKLAIFPKQNCVLANWEGIFQLIQEYYPTVSPVVLRFKKQLTELSFNEIEQQIYPQTRFRDIKNAPINNDQYIDERKLVELESPLLWQVRGFLYNVIGLNENFKGDGHVYNDSDKKMHAEYLIPNQEIKAIFGAQIFELA